MKNQLENANFQEKLAMIVVSELFHTEGITTLRDNGGFQTTHSMKHEESITEDTERDTKDKTLKVEREPA